MKELMLDELIAELQLMRKKIGRSAPTRYADGYDNALGIHCTAFHTEPQNWEGEPDPFEPYVELS